MLMRRVLRNLKKRPMDIEELAKSINDERTDLVDSLKSLKKMQLIYFDREQWHLTDRGLDVVSKMTVKD